MISLAGSADAVEGRVESASGFLDKTGRRWVAVEAVSPSVIAESVLGLSLKLNRDPLSIKSHPLNVPMSLFRRPWRCDALFP